jgi:hypothetical protein
MSKVNTIIIGYLLHEGIQCKSSNRFIDNDVIVGKVNKAKDVIANSKILSGVVTKIDTKTYELISSDNQKITDLKLSGTLNEINCSKQVKLLIQDKTIHYYVQF